MSNDPTRDIDEKYTTQPTIQTVLERLDDFRSVVEMNFEEHGWPHEFFGGRN